MKYVRNNIRYRSSCAKALESYYGTKSFVLSEMLRPSNGFSEVATELMLLKFSRYSYWLTYVKLLLLNKDKVNRKDTILMRIEFLREFAIIKKICKDNSGIFIPEFVTHWLEIHTQATHTMFECISETLNMSQIASFPFLVQSLVDYLNATLFELYELDCLLGSTLVLNPISSNNTHDDHLILFMDDVTISYGRSTGITPELERYAYYAGCLLKPDAEFPVEIRNYSTFPGNADPSIEAALIDKLSAIGAVKSIKVVKRYTAEADT